VSELQFFPINFFLSSGPRSHSIGAVCVGLLERVYLGLHTLEVASTTLIRNRRLLGMRKETNEHTPGKCRYEAGRQAPHKKRNEQAPGKCRYGHEKMPANRWCYESHLLNLW
jgi:hypothetical protein